MGNKFSQTPYFRRYAKATAMLTLSMSLVTVSQAKAMRCGTDLVSKGAYKEEVIAKCGQPYSAREQYWLYRKNNFVYRLHFNSKDRVRLIKSEIRF